MSNRRSIPFSVLDLSPVVAGSTPTQALRNTLDLARHAERLGFNRYWVAEHHGMRGIASAATSVVMGYIAGGTSTIRVGSGGVMLPNHAPLVIAEQFGTLESIYPGRIDLGLGRAPGTDGLTARALRRHLGSNGDTFPADLEELQGYFHPKEGKRVIAVPGEGLDIPIWLLGSSDFSARLAAQKGLPFAFASHFAPDYLLYSLDLYRREFRPSATLDKPHAMIGVNVVAADTDAEAERLFTSVLQQFRNLVRGTPGMLPPPVDRMDGLWTPEEREHAGRMVRCSAVGSPETVREELQNILDQTGADEIIATAQIYDHEARKRSFEILAGLRESIASPDLRVPVAALA